MRAVATPRGPRAGSSVSALRTEFYGRDGVVEVDDQGRVFIDGLWHSVLFRDDDLEAKSRENVRRKSGVLGWQLHVGEGGMRMEVKNIYLKKF